MSRIRTLGIREQAAWIRSRYPGFRYEIDHGLLVCRGSLQPTPVSAVYGVEIQYRTGTWPRVFVLGDQLQPLEPGGKIPHTYGPNQPCVFYPSGQAWRSDMKLAYSVLPWLSLWLIFDTTSAEVIHFDGK